jgi:hypothetical protein
VLYDNHQDMHDIIDTVAEKFMTEEEKYCHLCFPWSFLYFLPGLMIGLMSLIM